MVLVDVAVRKAIRRVSSMEEQCRMLVTAAMAKHPPLMGVAIGRTIVFYRFEHFKVRGECVMGGTDGMVMMLVGDAGGARGGGGMTFCP
jgi:hypothetical protein